MQSESLGLDWFPGSRWCLRLTPALPLCQSGPFLPSQLSAPGHLCHSVSSLCLARGQLGRVSAGVCAQLQSSQLELVGVGRMLGHASSPKLPDQAWASPSFSLRMNESPGFNKVSECIP